MEDSTVVYLLLMTGLALCAGYFTFGAGAGCKHPSGWLHVKKMHTVESLDDLHDKYTYHLYCMKCNEPIDVSFAEPNKKYRSIL